MKTFKHHNARSLKDAATLLSKYGGKAKVNAGGTDLLGTCGTTVRPTIRRL